MKQIELIDLTTLLRECAGEDEAVDMNGDVLDASFTDLGYDSIALLQVTGRIEHRYEVTLDEESVADADTPCKYLEFINTALAAKGA